MTENKNNSIEPGRPAWAAGLDLSAGEFRTRDEHLVQMVDLPALRGLCRRLADAEMRIAELERDREVLREIARACSEIHPIASQRSEPDYLIDRDGDAWHPAGDGMWSGIGGMVQLSRAGVEEDWGPVAEAWRAAPERGEPDFLIDGDGDVFRRVGQGVYWMQGGNSADWRRDELTGPVTEVWK